MLGKCFHRCESAWMFVLLKVGVNTQFCSFLQRSRPTVGLTQLERGWSEFSSCPLSSSSANFSRTFGKLYRISTLLRHHSAQYALKIRLLLGESRSEQNINKRLSSPHLWGLSACEAVVTRRIHDNEFCAQIHSYIITSGGHCLTALLWNHWKLVKYLNLWHSKISIVCNFGFIEFCCKFWRLWSNLSYKFEL